MDIAIVILICTKIKGFGLFQLWITILEEAKKKLLKRELIVRAEETRDATEEEQRV